MSHPMNNYYIYGLFDPETGELRYIGQTIHSLEKRLSVHMADSKKGKSYRKNWIKSLQDKGLKPIIQIIDSTSDINNLSKLEIYYISYFKNIGCRLTNLTNGGEGVPGRKLNEEQLNRFRKAAKIRGVTDKTRSALKLKISKKIIDLDTYIVYDSVSEASRQLGFKSSTSIFLILNSKSTSAHGKYFALFPENIIDIKTWCKNKKQELITMKKQRRLNVSNRLKKQIKCLNTNKIYESITEAAKDLKLNISSIVEVLSSRSKTIKGYKFEYV